MGKSSKSSSAAAKKTKTKSKAKKSKDTTDNSNAEKLAGVLDTLKAAKVNVSSPSKSPIGNGGSHRTVNFTPEEDVRMM